MSKANEALAAAPPARGRATNQQNAAEGIVDALIRENVKTVFGMTGDTVLPLLDAHGDFGMNAQELETSVREKLPVTVIIYNDVSFGALRIFQKMQHDGRYLGSHYGETDWVKLAQSYGADGIRVDRPGDLKAAVERAINSDVTTVLDVRIDPWELAHRSAEFGEFHRF